ncbi:MAG: hypothetical protein NZM04_09400 [Methylacidiphilales bacterium]|nr:hypothetical protein [Candidatus Methylacidiphilales bacterium]
MSDLKVLIDHFILEENIHNHNYREMLDYIKKHKELSEMILLVSIFNKSTSDLIKAQALIYLAMINSDKLEGVLYLYEKHKTPVIHTAAYIARCILVNSNEYAEKIIYYINKPGLIVAELVHLFDLVLDVCHGIHDAIYNEMRRFPSCNHFMINKFSIHFYLVICEKMGIYDEEVFNIIDRRNSMQCDMDYGRNYDLIHLFKNNNKKALRYIYNLVSEAVYILRKKRCMNDKIKYRDCQKITTAISILGEGQLDELYFLVNEFLLNGKLYGNINERKIKAALVYSINQILFYFDKTDKPFPSVCFGILLEKLFRFGYIDSWMINALVCYKNALAVHKIVECVETIDLMRDMYKKAVEKRNYLLIIKLEEKIRKIDPEGKYIHEIYDEIIFDDERKELIDRYNTQLCLDFYLRRIYEIEDDNIELRLISYLNFFISAYQKGRYPYSSYKSVAYCLALLILKNDLEQKDLINKVLDCFSHDKNNLPKFLLLLFLNNNEEWISLLFKYADKLLENPTSEIFNLLKLMDGDKILKCIIRAVQYAEHDDEIKKILEMSKNIWSNYGARILFYINSCDMLDENMKRIARKIISGIEDLEYEHYYI